MKANLLKLTVSSILLSCAIAQNSLAQVNWSCREVYSNEAMAKSRPYLSMEQVQPPALKEIESKIKEHESKIKERSYRRLSLEKDLNGEYVIPYMNKPQALKELETKIREEKEGLDREQRQLPMAKEELVKALAYLKNNQEVKKNEKEDEEPGFLNAYGYFARKKYETKWTQEDVNTLKNRISIYEKNAPIRKSNIEFFKVKINEIADPIIAQGLKAVKVELEEIINKDESRKKEIADLEVQRSKLTEKLRIEAVVLFKKALADNRLATPLNDLMAFYSLKNIATTNKVTLLVGSQLSGSNRIDYNQSMQIKELVKELIKKQYYIVFDGESNYAPYIAQLTGDFGVPVLSREQSQFADHKNKVIVHNDYLRMQVLSQAEAVIATPDSVTGMGLYTEGLTTHVLDVKGGFEVSSLSNWTKDLDKKERNLGITAKPVQIVTKAQQLFQKTESQFVDPFKSVTKFTKFSVYKPEVLNFESIQNAVAEAISFAKVMDKNQETGGSVIFGSSQEDSHSANLIYQSAYKLGQLGIAVATGGAGGAMEIANAGAFNSGGISIGIPIGGKHILDTEKNVASSKHTKTIVTSGYEQRIPALLGEGLDSRKFIIFAPGGNGTIKELATTLVRASGKFNSFQKIIFLDSDYYTGLFAWIQKSSLPKILKDKIVMVDKAEDVERIALQTQENFEKNRMQDPRKDQLTYEVKKFSGFKPKSFDMGKEWWNGPKKELESEKGKFKSKKQQNNTATDNNRTQNQAKHFRDPTEEQQHYQNMYNDYYE